MQRKIRSGLSRLGLLAGTAVLLTGCSAHQWEMKLRFGWPSGVTHQADRMRTLWTWSSVAALAVGVVVWGLIFWCCAVYRRKDDHVLPRQTKYHLPIEIAYSIAPFVIIAVLFYYTAVTENYVDKLSKNPDTLVQVDAFKWNWQFQYLQDGGTPTTYAATTSAGVPDPGAGSPLSTVGSSTEIPVLVVPVNQTVQIIEHSLDVIHSFWVPEFLFKRDVIPMPKDNRFEFTPTKIGSYVGRCAELCGTYHSQMNFEVRVVSQPDYVKYLAALKSIGSVDSARQSKALTAIGGSPCATTTHPFNTNRQLESASAQTVCLTGSK
ncbi:MAG: cytochrome c oxidase subunit [Frankiales bacterium]|nr:cytochrome c oxidase subunit [Frankiales bacterium]